MSAAAPIASAKGGRKALDAAMNLVPFIDLLSCCLSFLLITAVWSQVAGLSVDERPDGSAREEAPQPTTPRLTLYIDGGGYTLSPSDGQSRAIPRTSGHYDDQRLGEALRAAHDLRPDIAALEIRAADKTEYTDLIKAMDVALGAHFTALSVNGNDGV